MTTEPALTAVPALNRARQLEMYRRATRVMPGGTDSNFRAWGEDMIYVDRGQGGLVWTPTATGSSTCAWAMAP